MSKENAGDCKHTEEYNAGDITQREPEETPALFCYTGEHCRCAPLYLAFYYP